MAYPTKGSGLQSRLEAALRRHQGGDLDGALVEYRAILAVDPQYAPALNLLGTGLLQLGEAAAALDFLQRAARRSRDDPHVQANLAQAYIALERYREAGDAFRKASRIAPGVAHFHTGLAAALALEGRYGDAETLLRRLTARFPDMPLVWLNLGNVLRDTRRLEPALEAYLRARELDPQMVEARNSIGSVLHTLLRFAEAEREYRSCIADFPDYLPARFNLASALMDLGRFEEAEAVSRALAALAPAAPEPCRLVGTALGMRARLLEALPWYEKAAALDPDDAQTAQTLGGALLETGRAAEGLRWLAYAQTAAPDAMGVRQVSAGALLAHGRLQDGWIPHIHRPAGLSLRLKHQALAPVLQLPEAAAGLSVCVLAEQGLGDQLFYLRYVARLAARGARVVHVASRKLESLLARVDAFDAVMSEDAPLPSADLYVLAGDLPHALGAQAASALPTPAPNPLRQPVPRHYAQAIRVYWPPPAPSLRIAPLPDRLAAMAQRLAAAGPPPYVGITWRGGTAPEQQQTSSWLLYKQIDLARLAGALRPHPATFIALQRKPGPGEMQAFSDAMGRPLHDATELNNDLEGMLALLALLDDYIGVSNTNMHLRAAVGRTARVLVPAPAEWRWMQSGRASPWFPGFGIYRQSANGDWDAAFEALGRDLASAAAGRPAGA